MHLPEYHGASSFIDVRRAIVTRLEEQFDGLTSRS